MARKCLSCVMFLFLALSTIVFAQNEDLQPNVDYKVNKMKKVLDLTDTQVYAIRPIIKDYLTKRQAVLQDVAGQGIVDHVAVKGTLKELRDEEYQKLGKILSADQMEKWINKENFMAALNPDGGGSMVDDGPSLGVDGANFKF